MTLRALRPNDRELIRHFITSLSPETRRRRFFFSMNTPTEALLDLLCAPQARACLAIATRDETPFIVGVARWDRHSAGGCECTLVVRDDWQATNAGEVLMAKMLVSVREDGYEAIHSESYGDDSYAARVARAVGALRTTAPEDACLVHYDYGIGIGTARGGLTASLEESTCRAVTDGRV